jgi:hypothetical protein
MKMITATYPFIHKIFQILNCLNLTSVTNCEIIKNVRRYREALHPISISFKSMCEAQPQRSEGLQVNPAERSESFLSGVIAKGPKYI